MSYRKLLIALLVAAFVTAGCSDDDDGTAKPNAAPNSASADAGDDATTEEDMGVPEEDMGPAGPGNLTIEPELITFRRVRMGETASAEIVLRNLGESNIVVTQATIDEIDRQGEPEFRFGDSSIDGTTILEPQTSLGIDIIYEPDDTEADRGIVEIFSNDPETPMVTIPIETINAYPDLRAPRFVRFGQVTPGDTARQSVAIYNRGFDVLEISAVEVVDSPQRFQVEFLPDAVDRPPLNLEENQFMLFDVIYSPDSTQQHVGRIQVTSSDPDEPTVDIGLTGNNPAPCLVTEPRFIEFGELESGMTATQEVTVFNCGAVQGAEVDTIQLRDDGGGAVSLSNLPALPLTVSPLQTTSFEVSMSFVEPGLRIGEVEIVSDAGGSPYILQVRGNVPETE